MSAALNMHRCHSHIFVSLLSALGVPVHHGLISAHLCRLCRSRCEGGDEADICAVISHHQVGTSWLSPRHSIEIKDFHLRARHGGGRSRNDLAYRLRCRLRRRLSLVRCPNDWPAYPVVIQWDFVPYSPSPAPCAQKSDPSRGPAAIASGWPAAPAGSSQRVSELVPIIGPGLCPRGFPRDGVPRSCMHMPHRVLGRPEFGSGGPTTLPGETLWVPQ